MQHDLSARQQFKLLIEKQEELTQKRNRILGYSFFRKLFCHYELIRIEKALDDIELTILKIQSPYQRLIKEVEDFRSNIERIMYVQENLVSGEVAEGSIDSICMIENDE